MSLVRDLLSLSEKNCISLAIAVGKAGRLPSSGSLVCPPAEFGIEDQAQIFNLGTQRELGPGSYIS